MSINFLVTIHDDGLLELGALIQTLDRVEKASRNAAIITVIRIGNELELPQSLIQSAVFRVWTSPESLVLIKDIGSGSKWFAGLILTGVISVTLNNTVG